MCKAGRLVEIDTNGRESMLLTAGRMTRPSDICPTFTILQGFATIMREDALQNQPGPLEDS